MRDERKVLCKNDILGRLSRATLLLDSTAFIDAFKCADFMDFLVEVSEGGCALATILSVLYEFKRGAKDIAQINNYNKFIKELGMEIIPGMEDKAQRSEYQIFMAIYSYEAMNGRKEKGPSYTDSLLCLALYVYQHVDIRLLTTNYKDMPLSLFDREDILAFDTGRDVRTAAIYRLSEEKLTKELTKWRNRANG